MNSQAMPSPHVQSSSQGTAVILVGSRDMQTTFLSTLIRQELGRECVIQGLPETATESLPAPLVLLDCQSVQLEAAREFLEQPRDSPTRIALLNVQPDSAYERLVQWPQLKGLFYVTVGQPVLIAGLRRLLQGGDWLPRPIMQRLIDTYRRRPPQRRHDIKLTRRERQVLSMLLDGSTNLQIAAELSVSEYTVKSHLHNVFKKIDVKNRIQAYNWAQLHLGDS